MTVKIEPDRFSYLEKNSQQSREFVTRENLITYEYFNSNPSYRVYSECINKSIKHNLLLLKKRVDKIYSLKVDQNNNCKIVSFDEQKKSWISIINVEYLLEGELTENYDISNDGKYALIVVKNIWSIFYRVCIINLHDNKVIANIEQCNQAVFARSNKIYYQFNADENDFTQTHKVMCASIAEDRIENIEILLEHDELNMMEIIVSNNGRHIFTNILTDYYANDHIYYASKEDAKMKPLLTEDNGRNLYIGSDDYNHYFESNTIDENFSILALEIGNYNFSNAIEVIAASANKHAVSAKRASFVNHGKILSVEQADCGAILSVSDPKTRKREIFNCCGGGLYFGNMYHTSINENETILTSFENSTNGISVYELDITNMTHKLIYGEGMDSSIETIVSSVEGKKMKIHRLKNAEASRTIISFNSNPIINLCGNISNLNIKTPIREWVLRGGVYVEYDFSNHSLKEFEMNILDLDLVIDYLLKTKISKKQEIGLLQSDYSSSAALTYAAMKPENVGAICVVNGRTDLLNYVNDSAAYMFKSFIGNPEIEEEREVLKKFSPFEIAKVVKSNYPPQLLCALDYNMLVPSYHSKKLHALLKDKGFSNVFLNCMENEDFTEIVVEILSFFENELSKGGEAWKS